MVIREEDYNPKGFQLATPLLVVEVLSLHNDLRQRRLAQDLRDAEGSQLLDSGPGCSKPYRVAVARRELRSSCTGDRFRDLRGRSSLSRAGGTCRSRSLKGPSTPPGHTYRWYLPISSAEEPLNTVGMGWPTNSGR